MTYKRRFSSQIRAGGFSECYADIVQASLISTPPKGRVLIVDDHPIVLFGLRVALEQKDGFEICGEASSPDEARAMTATLVPDYLVLDLVMGGRDGIDLLKDLLAIAPGIRILVYSSQSEWRYAQRVLQAGARGYVAKSDGLDVVARAMEIVASDEIFIGDGLRRRLLDNFVEATPSDLQEAIGSLSERERQVLRMIGEGHGLGAIATALDLSVKTVGTYRDRLRTKLGISHARDLVIVAHDHL